MKNKYHIKVFEASAKDNQNVTEAFVYLTKLMMHVDDSFNQTPLTQDSSKGEEFSQEPSKASKPVNSFGLKKPSNDRSERDQVNHSRREESYERYQRYNNEISPC